MKKQAKIVLSSILIIIIIVILLIINGFFGNPISKSIARKSAEKYLEETYPNEAFVVGEVEYRSKSNNYVAECKIDGSKDRHFEITVNRKGEILSDNYENINDLSNTRTRIGIENRDFMSPYLDEILKSYEEESGIAPSLMFYEEFIEEKPDLYNKRKMKESELEIDKEYDAKELFAKLGTITVHINSKDESIENAANIITKIKNDLDKEGISFQEINFTLANHNKSIDENQINFTIPREMIPEDKKLLINYIIKRMDIWEFQNREE